MRSEKAKVRSVKLKSRECGPFDERVEKLAEFIASYGGGNIITYCDFATYLLKHLDNQLNEKSAGIRMKLDLHENGDVSNYLVPMAEDKQIPKNEIHLVVVDEDGENDTLVLRTEK